MCSSLTEPWTPAEVQTLIQTLDRGKAHQDVFRHAEKSVTRLYVTANEIKQTVLSIFWRF